MNFEEAKDKAVKYLVLALRTKKEVEIKLKKLKVDEEIIEQVIEYLISIDYINDSKYVDAYLRQCISIPRYSVYEIKMKLMQKGIEKDIIQGKLDRFNSKLYEHNLVEKLLNGKLKNMEPLKQKAYLYRRGFNLGDDIDM